MRRWADATCGGVARVQRLAGNVGYLDLSPVLFPPSVAGEAVACAMSLLSGTGALLVDLRRCLGGDPAMVALACSYLFDGDPVELSGVYDRATDRINQLWTLPHLPGRRLGGTKPVYLLTGATTFSGAEHVAYDLQQLGRATVVGGRTRGGAHPRRGFRVHPHLEATIPVARSVSPLTRGNWEGTGVAPDVAVPEADAARVGYRLALDHVLAAGTAGNDVLAEARSAGDDPFRD
jgi:C-terminal processing protease CtpA/Prc